METLIVYLVEILSTCRKVTIDHRVGPFRDCRVRLPMHTGLYHEIRPLPAVDELYFRFFIGFTNDNSKI